jgi:autotransporter-associated beta strand protein
MSSSIGSETDTSSTSANADTVVWSTADIDVVDAVYLRAGQVKSAADIAALMDTVGPQITFDAASASEQDIVDLMTTLGLTDASLPPPPAAVPLTRTLPDDVMPAYGGTEPDIIGMTATQLEAMLNAGEITSRQIVLQYMYRIQEYDHAGPALRSVAQLNPDLLTIADADDAARAAAKANGTTLPPLFGIPVLVKGNIDTDDNLFTTAGSAALIGSEPDSNATVVTGLLDQGAIIMGKANMGQWAGMVSNDDSSTGGQTLDPYDPTVAVAGSSSGPSIAINMNFAPVTVGTQTSDSLIYPAQQQQIYTLKPTEGLVSTTGIAPYSSPIDVAGPMANSVGDLALMLNAMTLQDTVDTTAASYVRPDYTANLTGDLTGMTIGVYDATPTDDTSRSPLYAQTVTAMLTASGATVLNIDRTGLDAAVKTAVLSLSDADLETFITMVGTDTLPTDPTQLTAFLADYRNNFSDGTNQLSNAMENSASLAGANLYTAMANFLADRTYTPADFQSAFVKLLGTDFTQISTAAGTTAGITADSFPNTTALVELFGDLNPDLDSGDTIFQYVYEGMAQEYGYNTDVQAAAAYADWIRISTALMVDVRQNLGIQAGVGFIGTDDNTNDGVAAYGNLTDQMSYSPELSVPATIGGVASAIVIDANSYQEQTLLQIGQALQNQLSSPAFIQDQKIAADPPASGFTDQPQDNGPLLPLVLDNLDDTGQAEPADLLSTVMAPLTLNVTTTTGVPESDGIISGDGGLIKEGVGTQGLNGVNVFTGDVQVWQGTLQINADSALGDPSNAVTLQSSSGLVATADLTLDRAITLDNGGALGAFAGVTMIEDGAISGNAGLTITGSGQVTLSGLNAYTGGTVIDAGVLAVSSDQNFGQDYGEVTFDQGATLVVTQSFDTHRQMHLIGDGEIDVAASMDLANSNIVDGSGALTLDGTGELTLSGDNSFSGGVTIESGTLILGAADAAGTGAIAFGGGDPPDLSFTIADAPTNTIAGFTYGDTIDITDLADSSITSVSFSTSSDVLDIDYTGDAGAPLALNFAAGTPNDFATESDGAAGTTLFEAIACFQRGTRILTTRGEALVETIHPGDMIVLARPDGPLVRPVVWMGHRRIDCTRHPDPGAVWPILVREHAFGTGLPQRNLWLSPEHAIFLDGVLIPVKQLVDDEMIVQIPLNTVEYWHVELADHDVLLAEGLPCESYLDTGNRDGFVNGAAFAQAHPDFSPKHWSATCAPLVLGGAHLHQVRGQVRTQPTRWNRMSEPMAAAAH